MTSEELMTDRYMENAGVLICLKCATPVYNLVTPSGAYLFEIHDKWHENQRRVADDAHWGGMNRPIGGHYY